jgi:hypothetical protein
VTSNLAANARRAFSLGFRSSFSAICKLERVRPVKARRSSDRSRPRHDAPLRARVRTAQRREGGRAFQSPINGALVTFIFRTRDLTTLIEYFSIFCNASIACPSRADTAMGIEIAFGPCEDASLRRASHLVPHVNVAGVVLHGRNAEERVSAWD